MESEKTETIAAVKKVEEDLKAEMNTRLAKQEADHKEELSRETTALKQANETLKGRFLS